MESLPVNTDGFSERTLVMTTHTMLGNTGIQLAVSHIMRHYFSIPKFYIETNNRVYVNMVKIDDDIWENIYPFLGSILPPRFDLIHTSYVCMQGYFQISEPLVRNRQMILEKFKSDTTTVSTLFTMKDCMAAKSPIHIDPEDIVLHIRLGDFIKAKIVIDPAPQLAILRNTKMNRLIIVCSAPKTDAERNYLLLFEEFHPIFQHGTELEDFAVLRCANRILVTNSTFSWFAAFLGSARDRWIPVPKYNELKKIDETDILYEAADGYDIGALSIPETPFLPVSGEFLQSLCDYTILDRVKKSDFNKTIDYAHPPERQLFIEESWPDSVRNATSLFIYPTENNSIGRHVFSFHWPNLKLIIFHNSDYGLDYDSILPFLEKNPDVYIWAQNSTEWHPRIRPLPIGEENRIWRGGNEIYEPPNTISRSNQRDIDILVPHWSNTHPIRPIWRKQAMERRDITIVPKLNKGDYLERVTESRAIVCPPGNGVDTHRCWDALTKGAWAIVEGNTHTLALLKQYPSLHLISVKDMTSPIHVPDELPPFHPLLLRSFWETLFRSYIICGISPI